jgi:ubiquinone/menaquinone biosynthesis C-methylase UbiE
MLKMRSGMSPHHTAVAMVGARGGDRVLVVGAHDAGFAAELGQATGLTGEVRVADDAAGAAARVDAAVRKSGALVEFDEAPATRLPYDAHSFDVVVLNRRLANQGDQDRALTIGEAIRVAKPGGRIVAIEESQATGLLARFSKPAIVLATDVVQQLLASGGCRATRLLAEVGGATFVEALTARS